MDNPLSTPYTPMGSPPPNTHKINANLDLPADFKPTEDHSSPLPLSVGQSFYKKRGELYQKNSAARRKFHGQAKVNQFLECRQSNVTGTLQENISSLKQKLPFSNPQIFPSQLGSIAVAEHILQHGPLLPTTDLCAVYKNAKETASERRMMAGELFGIVSKYLNIMQLYINGHTFISENTTSDFQALVSFINNQNQSRKHLNNSVEDLIGDCFNEALQYMDSKRDRDTVIGLMERLTRVNFVTKKLRNVQNKKAVQGCRDTLKENL